MAKNTNRRSTSFTREEVELACDLFRRLWLGEDPESLIHRKGYRDLASRFLRMREALRNNVAIREVSGFGGPAGTGKESCAGGHSRAVAV